MTAEPIRSAQELLTRRIRLPGPVATTFYRDRNRLSAIMGPVGSGKTSVAVAFKPLAIAAEQKPWIDGVRYTKGLVIRDTYRNLLSTAMETWREWVPPSIGGWFDGPPAWHEVRLDLPDGTKIDMTVDFLGIGDARLEDLLRGREYTWAFVNEADRVAPSVIPYLITRIGRYPPKSKGGASWRGVWADFNAPDWTNHAAKTFDTERKPGVAFYRQPSGLSPHAENLANLPEGYYQDQIALLPEWLSRRMVLNEYGISREGKPVFPEFQDGVHMANSPFKVLPRLPCHLTGDAGRTPAILLHQQTASGQHRFIDELIFEGGARELGRAIARWLARDHPEALIEWAVGDPAGDAMSSTEERSYWRVVQDECGIRFKPARSNLRGPREEAMREALNAPMVEGQPHVLISPACRKLREALGFGFRFRRIQGAEGRYDEVPEKNEWSHVAEAGEYIMLEYRENEGSRLRRARGAAAPRQVEAITPDNPRGVYAGTPRQRIADVL